MRAAIAWDEVFGWMRQTGAGPRAAARQFRLPAGTVCAAVHREHSRPGGGRLGGGGDGQRVVCPACGAKFDAGGAPATPTEA